MILGVGCRVECIEHGFLILSFLWSSVEGVLFLSSIEYPKKGAPPLTFTRNQ